MWTDNSVRHFSTWVKLCEVQFTIRKGEKLEYDKNNRGAIYVLMGASNAPS